MDPAMLAALLPQSSGDASERRRGRKGFRGNAENSKTKICLR
jgi:hypothetical protein